MIDHSKRQTFAAFFERLASGPPDREDWGEHAINHYLDEQLEAIRRRCVRLSIQAGEPFPRTQEHRLQLRAWAEELRRDNSE